MDSPPSRTDSELDHTSVFVDFSHLAAVGPESTHNGRYQDQLMSVRCTSSTSIATQSAALDPLEVTTIDLVLSGPGVDLAAGTRRRQRAAAVKRIAHFIWRRWTMARLRTSRHAACVIQGAWKVLKPNILRYKQLKFTMNGRIPLSTAHKVLALLLGRRVRRLMRTEKVKQARSAIVDLSAVLSDMLHSDGSSSDSAFVASVSSQISHLKTVIWNVFFEFACWRPAPFPGYWYLCSRRQNLADERRELTLPSFNGYDKPPSVAHVPAAVRKVTPSPRPRATIQAPSIGLNESTAEITNTRHQKPHIKRTPKRSENDIKLVSLDKISGAEKKGPIALAMYLEKSNPAKISNLPDRSTPAGVSCQSLSIVDERPLTGLGCGGGIFSAPALGGDKVSHSMSRVVDAERRGRNGSFDSPVLGKAHSVVHKKQDGISISKSLKSLTPTSADKKIPPNDKTSMSTDRGGPYISSDPHVDIWINRASRLMPATRGKVPKDASGEPIPDRMPSLRVFMIMPKTVGSQEMKKGQCYKFDNASHTLNPEWNWHLRLPLPLLSGKNLHDGSEFNDSVCKSHFKMWGCGSIHIEVVDIDRFNENIFMGETTILLSALLGPVRDFQCPLSISGDFNLSKKAPSDRVSGFVSVNLSVLLPRPISVIHISQLTSPQQAMVGVDHTDKVRPSGKKHNNFLTSDSRSINSRKNTESFMENSDSSQPFGGPSDDRPSVDHKKNNIGHPVMSNKLSQRIRLLKRRNHPAVGANFLSGCGDSMLSPSIDINIVSDAAPPSYSPEPLKSIKVNAPKERRTLFVSRYTSGSASHRLAQVTQQLQGLETALQHDADAALGNIYRKLDEITTPQPVASKARSTPLNEADANRIMRSEILGGNCSKIDHLQYIYTSSSNDPDSDEGRLESGDELIVLGTNIRHHKQHSSSDLDSTVLKELEMLSKEIGVDIHANETPQVIHKDSGHAGSESCSRKRTHQGSADADTTCGELAILATGDDSGDDDIVFSPHESPRYGGSFLFKSEVEAEAPQLLAGGNSSGGLCNESYSIEEEFDKIEFKGRLQNRQDSSVSASSNEER